MRIISNESKIRRNARIGQVAAILGLLILLAGMIVAFRWPNLFTYSWGALLLGFILSQVGIYFGNRWGRRPRPDEHLANALKGLDDRFSLYNWSSPVSHLLVGPAGVWILIPRSQAGKVTFEKGRWRVKGGGVLRAYLNLFAQEGLGRPDLDVAAETQTMERFFKKNLPEEDQPEIQAALVFTNDQSVVEDMDEAPVPTVPVRKLKEVIRKAGKNKSLSATKVDLICQALES